MRFFCVACVFGILVAIASSAIRPSIDSPTLEKTSSDLEITNFVSAHNASAEMATPLMPVESSDEPTIEQHDSVQLTAVSN